MGMIGRGFKRFKRSLINSLACGSTSLLASEPPPPPPPPPHHHSDAPPSTALISDSALSESGTSTAAPHDDPCAAPVAVVALASDADTPTSPPLPVDGDRSSASVLIIDLVSIHSGILSSSSEARRNPQSFFLDAFSRSSHGRDSDSPSVVFATSHPDHHLGPRDRWLLDLTGDLHFDRATRESRYHGSRGRERGGQRWPSRYEMFHDVHDERDWRASSLCDSGIHPRGTCFCDSPTAEEPSSRSRVSQIFMLADALFEVLEEIHRQRLSLSLSMVAIPAPEVVVDSLPLKSYKKSTGADTGIDDVLQCHICLEDYEEGDQIRALPCSHEYHMSCVDKWLKEVQGVCPLCRGDVCKDMEGSTSQPQVSSA